MAFLTPKTHSEPTAAAECVFTVLGNLYWSPEEVNNYSGQMTRRKYDPAAKIREKTGCDGVRCLGMPARIGTGACLRKNGSQPRCGAGSSGSSARRRQRS